MGLLFLLVWLTLANSVWGQLEPWAYQLEEFKNSTDGPIGILTLPTGAPVPYDEAYQSLNTDSLIYNRQFMETMASLNRERVPERINHGKGVAALGYLEVTHDITNITNAALFSNVGKKTPCAVRFSQAFSERGSPDTTRGVLGFAAKFYTEEGNWDLLGLSAQSFFFKDPLFFAHSLHVVRRNPKTGIVDSSAFLDFFFQRPESYNFLLDFFGDSGIYESYRYAPSYAYHAFQVENNKQDICFARFIVIPDAGRKYMNQARATELAGSNPDYYVKDLYNAIATGNFPSWTLGMQVIPYHKVKDAPFDIFDVTFRWPLDLFPIHPIGKVILNKMPDNQFATSEQLAVDPANQVPGIQGVDTLFQGRSFAYRDTQRHRMGGNVDNIEVNRPRCPTYTYNRDGHPPVGSNHGSIPNYYPNSFNGPVPAKQTRTRTKRVKIYTDPGPTNLWQATEYYNSLPDDQKQRIVENIVATLLQALDSVQQRGVEAFRLVSSELADAIQNGLTAAASKK